MDRSLFTKYHNNNESADQKGNVLLHAMWQQLERTVKKSLPNKIKFFSLKDLHLTIGAWYFQSAESNVFDRENEEEEGTSSVLSFPIKFPNCFRFFLSDDKTDRDVLLTNKVHDCISGLVSDLFKEV